MGKDLKYCFKLLNMAIKLWEKKKKKKKLEERVRWLNG